MDVSREENEILDLTLILTAHSQSKTQDLESEVKLVQESATQDLNKQRLSCSKMLKNCSRII